MGSEIVVIGGGTAGVRLARRLGDAGMAVTVLGEETHAPYNRVLLAEVLAGRYGPEVIELPHAGVRRGVRVTGIDRERRRVACADGTAVPYDRLVLATGSNPVLPPLRGIGPGLPQGVHPFRTLDDCLALSASVRPGTRAVVIGGGLLGVSAARALAARGARVVLAQQGERLMERHLDPAASRLLHSHVEALGVEVHTECRVRGLRTADRPGPHRLGAPGAPGAPGADEAAPLTAVELADGYTLDADLAVIACGVRPRVSLAQDAGLAVDRGIVVDDELRTSDPYIHAIGDCAQHAGVVHGLAGPALEQADVLAQLLTHESRVAPARPALATTGASAGGPSAAGGDTPSPRTAAASGGHTPADSGASRNGVASAAGNGRVPSADSASGDDAEDAASPVPAPRYTGTRALTRLTLAAFAGDSAGDAAGDPADAGSGNTPPGPLDLAAFGDPVPQPGDDVVQIADATRGAYRKVVVRGDRLVGGVLLGDLAAVGELARAWEDDEVLPESAPLHQLLTDNGGL
ncbi:FAD-dependent oxidoreductase [Streptomyces sp. HNM0663]|uniref:FAD-dependent oxidoreductase n=1 Tax=Streptomyces chengmaiensis TaxID=3040919 RepID=A0ABT6HY33_9ACTN|nr:FAD-dependent oxidoreductase [Streptomyces chengmaiensis]MDH2393622.1 FAD-dependent oxidoreductase [Streptomyces chengmaiensis]